MARLRRSRQFFCGDEDFDVFGGGGGEVRKARDYGISVLGDVSEVGAKKGEEVFVFIGEVECGEIEESGE